MLIAGELASVARQVQRVVDLPRWFVSLFVDPAFDQQMKVHDDASDMRRLERIRRGTPLRNRSV